MPNAIRSDGSKGVGAKWLSLFSVFFVGLLLSQGAPRMDAQVTHAVFPTVSLLFPNTLDQPTDTGVRRPMTVHMQDSTLIAVLHAIAHQAHVELMYNDADPRFAKRITVAVTNVKVMDAFAQVLQGTGLSARLASDGGTVMIRAQRSLSGDHARFAGGTIVGRVIDSVSGQGLGGASVKVAGTKLAAVTSDSGKFTFEDVLPGDQVLNVRLFGYKPVERTVTVVDSQRTTVRIVMVSVPTVLSGVITTATGQQRRIEVGNDITSINVDSIIKVAPVTSVTDLLETRVPGLTVQHSDGVPGDPSRLRLRGASSVQLNNDPIVIVDGIRIYANQSDPRNNNLAAVGTGGGQASFAAPSPVDQIDPNSIATIEVFKGPSATAIYGSDAANGVIVITLKHGRAGPTQWNLDLAAGVNWLPGNWPVNYYRFGVDGTQKSTSGTILCNWYDPSCVVDSVIAFQALNQSQYTLFSHGDQQQATLSVSGGVPTLQYHISGSGSGDLGYLKLPSIEQQRYDSAYGPIPADLVRPDRYVTWGVTGSLTAQPNTTLRVTLQSSLFNGDQQQSSLQGAIPQIDGEYISPALLSGPLVVGEVLKATDNSLSSTNSLSFHWQPYAWLPLDGTGGINTIQRTDVGSIPFGINSQGPEGSGGGDTAGFYSLGRGATHEQTLTVGTSIPLHYTTLSVGGNLYNESIADFQVTTNQLAPGVTVPTIFLMCDGSGSSACSSSSTTQSTSNQSTYGWYLEPRLNFGSRFFAAPGFRLDGGSGGSTSSGSLGGLSAFPKIDLSYVAVDRQSQRPLWGFLTLLRPRIAFGLAGTQPGPADKLRLFNVGLANYSLTAPGSNNLADQQGACLPTVILNGSTAVPAVCLNALGNTQLRPERSSELEGGMDAIFWQGRFSVTYTQYNKTRHDAILAIPVAPSIGGGVLANYEKNIGEIRNTGTEIQLNTVVLQNRAVSWNIGANLSNNNSLVMHLNPGQAPICFGAGTPCQGTRIVAGYPLFGEWALPIAGFADANHDGIIEPNEIRYDDSSVYVGQPAPKYQFNLSTDLSLLNGRLSVHATFAYQNGLTQDDQGACGSKAFSLLPNAPSTTLAEEAAVVAANCGILFSEDETSGIGLIQTVNTFRFQDLSINYVLPKRVAIWFRVPTMSLALQGSNLGLHTNYRGIDPNVNAFSTVSAGDQTEDTGQIPEPRQWWLKLTMGN